MKQTSFLRKYAKSLRCFPNFGIMLAYHANSRERHAEALELLLNYLKIYPVAQYVGEKKRMVQILQQKIESAKR